MSYAKAPAMVCHTVARPIRFGRYRRNTPLSRSSQLMWTCRWFGVGACAGTCSSVVARLALSREQVTAPEDQHLVHPGRYGGKQPEVTDAMRRWWLARYSPD